MTTDTPNVVDPAELVSVGDIAWLCGVTSPAVSNWTRRGIGFPEPVATVAHGHIALWLWPDVEAWLARRPVARAEARLAQARAAAEVTT